MIYSTRSILNEENINLSKLIENNSVNIAFGHVFGLEESHPVLINGFTILIRNRFLDGVDGKQIPHPTPTIKIIAGSLFKYDGMLGVPLEIDPEIKLYKKADNPSNRKNLRPYIKIIKKFVKENKDLILEYWNIDPNSVNGITRLTEIEDEISSKYLNGRI